MKGLTIGIVGCGAIGTSLARAVDKEFSGKVRLICLYDIDKKKAVKLAGILKGRSLLCNSLDYLIRNSNIVIEAAAANSSLLIAKKVLTKGRDIIIMSVGGIVADISRLRRIAQTNQARVYIPSGAVCGIDGLKAAAQRGIKKVTLITRKNPHSFEDSVYLRRKGIRLDRISKDILLFSGNAGQAVKIFPQNINVAATLSMAGIGQEKTRVKIIASPKVERNIHEIYIESDAGIISTRVENLPHPDNKKTSLLAVLSAIATLKQILEPVKIGT